MKQKISCLAVISVCLLIGGCANVGISEEDISTEDEYYGAAEPPVRCGVSHLSGLTEPPVYSYSA